MKPTRIGIIGVGQIGKSHLEAYAKIPEIEVVAAADLNEAELNRVSDLYDIPNRYADFRELLKRDDIEAVDVCLHNNYHAPVTIEALQAGKHVYCEKPIAGSYADGKAMLEAAAANKRMLHVQLAQLYTAETKAAKLLIEGGKLGRVYHARSAGHRRRGRPYVDGYGSPTFVKKEEAAGGALFDMGVYHISQLLYLMGNPRVARVSGKTYQEIGMDEARKELSGYNVEELGLGFVRFEDGLTLDIIEAWAVQLGSLEGSSIVGSEGGVRLNPFSYHATLCDLDMNATFDLGAMSFRHHQLRENEHAYDSSQHHWAAVLQGRVPLLPTAEIALQTMLISEGIYISDRLGREVTAEEVLAFSESKAILL
ncbi:Gfo/Idh/MocA family oxidoreductase [Paenibacillus rhizovicinus]|uniref:Gfo/Idh/MocA family oxidoreductase n=1 Tax=Paenibacillus rhizovicinus TaxID=2704463 RepID=A0A6C0NZ83_9BACL|nr:Gfo/Idh/MocA family oxidoreductase [Paenibacillus rhizovicinus]QHW29782.1 Gfo/Idh/MocA family oxidoreductase [Paenibacillus rhizovicinus]